MRFMMSFLFVPILGISFLTNAQKNQMPPSPSYQAMVQCVPELSDPEQMQKVQLDRVRKYLDINYPTQQKTLKYRWVDYRLSNGELRRVKYFRTQQKGVWGYALELQKTTDKGVELLPVPKDQQWNAKPDVVKQYIEIGQILKDEESLIENKTGGRELSLEVINGKVQLLELTQVSLKKSLLCKTQNGNLVICLCKSL